MLYSFVVEEAFLPANKFAKIRFHEADEVNMRDLVAAGIYQDLINRHLKSGNTYALVDVDLRRLAFAKERAAGAGKDIAYRDALKAIWENQQKHPASALAAYRLAQWYAEQAGSNPPPNEAHAKDYLIAEEICNEAIKLHPESEGAGLCKTLVANINDKDIGLQTEAALPVGEDFRFLLSYSNLDRAYMRIAKLTPAAKKRIESYDWNEREKVAEMLAKLEPIQTWDSGLPSAADHHPHSVEVMAKGLDADEYIILASDNPEFSMTHHALAFVTFTVTDLAFVSWDRGNTLEVFVRDRNAGRSVKNAKVKADAYSWRRGDDRGKQVFSGKTDKNGEVDIEIPMDENRFKLYFISKKEKDRYETDINYFYNYRENYSNTRKKVAFFLDRTIYRPGQTIYVKGLVMESNGEAHRILPGFSTSISLFDVNGQEVKKLDVKTNEYGTFSTTFTAPGALTGRMTLRCEGNSHSFSVEEYKRPTFEVKMEKPKGEVSLGETIEVEGKAIAYAGNAIDGAEVNYRIVREANFPYWGWRWWLPRPSSPSREIGSGTTTTEPDGTFKIDVNLIPDATLDKETQPVFTYTVYADVVDIAGETHSAQTAVRAAYIGVELSASVSNRVEMGSLVKVNLAARNLSGGDAKLNATLKLFMLEAPKELLRNRKWSKPDQHLYSQSEWKNRLPHEVYDNEDNPQSWTTSLKKEDAAVSIGGSKEYDLGNLLAPGKYRIELSAKDDKGQEVKSVSEFTVEDSDAKAPVIPTWLDVRASKGSAEPGETVSITLRSSLPKTDLVLRVVQKDKVYRKEFIRLKGSETVEIDIDESMRGGLDVQVIGLAMNQNLSENIHIKVPWTNKELKLEWMSFRSPLEPGSEEKWKLKVSGPKGEAVAAEFVTAMYDASLEAFSSSNTYGLSLYPSYHASLRGISDGWGSNSGNVFSLDWNEGVEAPRPHGYDQLKTFGFEYGPRAYRMLAFENRRMMASARGAVRERDLAEKQNATGFYAAPAAEAARADFADDFGGAVDEVVVGMSADADGVPDILDKEPQSPPGEEVPVPLRTNLQETAFFFPQLKTNEAGEIELVFTMPEALTRWRLTGLAHTKALDIGTISGEVVTQKDLMVRPHLPRFLREGDAISLSSRVVNLTESEMKGEANLQILDAVSMKDISAELGIASASRSFTAKAKQTGNVSWDIKVPQGISAVVLRVTARANGKADGEENILPVLSNRMLVTESMPMPVRGAGTTDFTFTKLLNSDQSSTLRHHQLSLEFTPNPVWYAVKALPYLMEYPHECAEQVFSRYYANALASHVANSKPRIKQVFETWKREATSSGGFVAALEQNADLKAVVMEETPWVLDAQNDKLRQERIALLFDLNRMADEAARARQQLANMQYNNGAFPWFENMPESRYITTLIVTGFGHLQKLGVSSAGNPEIAGIVQKALPWLDAQLAEDLRRLKQYTKSEDELKKDHLGWTQIQYLYMRSFFKDVEIAGASQEALPIILIRQKATGMPKTAMPRA
ncbi:MAG: alpha-2-macroglobulin family protein [Bacteroidia bacterium]